MDVWEIFFERVKEAVIFHYGENLLAGVIFGSAVRTVKDARFVLDTGRRFFQEWIR